MHYLGHEGAVAEHSLDLLHCHVLALVEGTRKGGSSTLPSFKGVAILSGGKPVGG